MNKNSVLCRFIAEHPGNWEEKLRDEYGVKVRREGGYAIFNYGFDCNFADPVVQEARGIILDVDRLEVVCWPFRKFGNHHESYADPIDWAHARVLEKVDGSIIKLWFDRKKQDWQFSTNGTIRAENAPAGELPGLDFGMLIRRADNFGDIPFNSLDRDFTYIFELVSPETRVVIPYETTSLYHTGTRSNISGKEMDVDIGVRKPASYPISSLQDCIAAAVALNRDGGEDVTGEGYVVVDYNWNRVKVKSPDYILKHRLMQMKTISREDALEMVVSASPDIAVICGANPSLIPLFKYYDYHLSRLRLTATRLGELARSLYAEYSRDRAAVAKVISRHPLAWVGFRCLSDDRPGSDHLMEIPVARLCNMIPDYQDEDLKWLFLQNEENK